MAQSDFDDVKLVSPDSTETFILPVNQRIQREVKVNLLTKTAANNAAEVLGWSPNLQLRKFTITFSATNIKTDDYPNFVKSTYTNNNIGFEEELANAVQRWGPTLSDTTTLQWNKAGHTFSYNGVITDYNSEFNFNDRQTNLDVPSITIVFTSVDVFELND